MATKIPQDKRWSQLNQGDIFGALFATRNIDLDVPGVLRLAQRTNYVGQSTTNFGNVLRILYFSDGNYWIATSDKLFKMTGALASFAVDALSDTPTLHDGSDATVRGNQLLVTKTARVSRLVGTTWSATLSDTDFTNTASGFPHPIEVNVNNNNVLVGDGASLLKLDTASGVIDEAISIPSVHRIEWIRAGNGVNYIGCSGIGAQRNGAVYIWDGNATTTGYNRVIPMDSPRPLSGVVDERGVLHILTLDGRLQVFNGQGFETIAELPPVKDYYARMAWGDLTTYHPVRQRGMDVIKGKIHIAVSAGLANSGLNGQFMVPSFQSGVWVFDRDSRSFYHKYALSNSNTGTDFGQSYGPSMAGAFTPYRVDLYRGGGEAGESVGGVFIGGGKLNPSTIAGTSLGTIVSATTGTNRGSFVTSKIESQQATDKIVAVWCKYQGLETANDKILFKYRTKKRKPVAIGNGVTWNSNVQFVTISTDDATKMSTVQVGDEITVLSGNGAGCSAHITAISESSDLYTVTLDEAIVGVSASNTGHVMIENWKKNDTVITSSDEEGYKRITFDVGDARWFEIKGELRGEGGVVGIEELALIGSTQKPLV